MDLRQLRYFTVLAEELHFRRSAERLNITQAPLSIAVQSLERELGAQLFHRTNRRVALTEYGVAFRAHAAAVLDRVQYGVSDIRKMASGHAGELRIGFTAATSLLPFFPQIISTFRTAYPDVTITLRDLTSAAQVHALQDRAIDVGFIRSHQPHPPLDLSFTRLLRDPLVAAMRDDHALCRQPTLTIGDLRDQPLLFYPKSSGIGIYQQVMQACSTSGFEPFVVQEALDASTLVGLAATGLGVAIVPAELRCIAVPRVVYRALAGPEAMTELLLAARAGEASALVANLKRLATAAIAAGQSPE